MNRKLRFFLTALVLLFVPVLSLPLIGDMDFSRPANANISATAHSSTMYAGIIPEALDPLLFDLYVSLILTLILAINAIFVFYFVIRFIRKDKKLENEREEFRSGNDYHKYISSHDILTNLANKEYLRQRFNQIALSSRGNVKMALFFIDLDKFKEVNDVMGHNVGDILLDKAAQALREVCTDNEIVARAGGDEFLILRQYQDISELEALGERVVSAFNKPISLINNNFIVTASVGAALYPDHGWDFQELYKNADTAMYTSKKHGRNKVSFYAPEMRKQILNDYNTLNYLRNFEEHIYLEYQPLVWLDTGEIAGFEALSRMKADDRFIPPSEFVKLAIENGLIVAIGNYTLREACGFIMRAQNAGIDAGVITVNISAVQIFDDDFIPTLSRILQQTGVNPKKLLLEITEDAVIDYQKCAETIAAIRALGVNIGIDDFGTGYSSLSYFARLPFMFVKIAQDFVNDIAADRTKRLLEAIINIADTFDMFVCAEGIESEEQLNFLRNNNCHLGQGFLFSKSLGEQFILNNSDSIREIIKKTVTKGGEVKIPIPHFEDFHERSLFTSIAPLDT